MQRSWRRPKKKGFRVVRMDTCLTIDLPLRERDWLEKDWDKANLKMSQFSTCPIFRASTWWQYSYFTVPTDKESKEGPEWCVISIL